MCTKIIQHSAKEVGKTYKVEANTDESINCSYGISLASLDWCLREWRDGYHILIAEFAVKDIAAIPIGSDGKFRVHQCKIVKEKPLTDCGEGLWSAAKEEDKKD